MIKMIKPIVLVLAALALASLACSFGGSEELPAGVLFQDDFEDTSSGWDEVNLDEGITNYENGYYRIFVNDTQTDYWANPGLSFTDTVVEVDATKAAGPDDNDFGVICRYQDVNNFYFMIVSSDGYYAIGKVLDGEYSLVEMDDMLPSDAIKQGNTTNQVVGECVGSTLTLSANGSALISVSDSSFASGDVGLMAGSFDEAGTDIHFDNFVVREP